MDRQELYRLALTAEIRSQNLYGALAKSFRNQETSSFFNELVHLEKAHEDKIRKAMDHELPGMVFIVDAAINQDFAGMDFSDPMKVLDFALGREDLAHNLYMDFASQTADLNLKAMLLRLAEEEDEHKTLLLTEMQRIQGALQWYDPSELNGLMED